MGLTFDREGPKCWIRQIIIDSFVCSQLSYISFKLGIVNISRAFRI